MTYHSVKIYHAYEISPLDEATWSPEKTVERKATVGKLQLNKRRTPVKDVRGNGSKGDVGIVPFESVTIASTTQNPAFGMGPGPANPKSFTDYAVRIDADCDECGGSGFHPGGIDPWGPELCPKCHGAKTQTITRNYLVEAFQIAGNPKSMRSVERSHLVAIIQHCRQMVSALMSLPEMFEQAESLSMGPTVPSQRRHHKPRQRGATVQYHGQTQKEKR